MDNINILITNKYTRKYKKDLIKKIGYNKGLEDAEIIKIIQRVENNIIDSTNKNILLSLLRKEIL